MLLLNIQNSFKKNCFQNLEIFSFEDHSSIKKFWTTVIKFKFYKIMNIYILIQNNDKVKSSFIFETDTTLYGN